MSICDPSNAVVTDQYLVDQLKYALGNLQSCLKAAKESGLIVDILDSTREPILIEGAQVTARRYFK